MLELPHSEPQRVVAIQRLLLRYDAKPTTQQLHEILRFDAYQRQQMHLAGTAEDRQLAVELHLYAQQLWRFVLTAFALLSPQSGELQAAPAPWITGMAEKGSHSVDQHRAQKTCSGFRRTLAFLATGPSALARIISPPVPPSTLAQRARHELLDLREGENGKTPIDLAIESKNSAFLLDRHVSFFVLGKWTAARRRVFFFQFCVYAAFMVLFVGASLKQTSSGMSEMYYLGESVRMVLTPSEFQGRDQFVFTFSDEAAFSEWMSVTLLPQVIAIPHPRDVASARLRIGAMRLWQRRKSLGASFGHAHPHGLRSAPVDRAFEPAHGVEQSAITPSLVSFVGNQVVAADGFSLELGNCSAVVCKAWWEEARARGWIDDETGVVATEFTLFDRELSVLSAVSVVSDFLPSGRVLVHWAQHLIKTEEWFSLSSVSFLAEIGIVLILPIFALQEWIEVRSKKMQVGTYLSSLWNILECLTIGALVPVLGMSFASRAAGLQLRDALTSGSDSYVPLHAIGRLIVMHDHCNAFVSILVWMKLLKFLTVFKTFGILLIALEKMLADFFSFSVILMVFLLGFAHAAHLIHYAERFTDRSFVYSMVNAVRTLYGDSAYDPGQFGNQNEAWAGNLLLVCQVGIGFVLLLNLLVAVLSQAYNAVIEDATNRYAIDFARLVSTVELGSRDAAEESLVHNKVHHAKPNARLHAPGPTSAWTAPKQPKLTPKVLPEDLRDLVEASVTLEIAVSSSIIGKSAHVWQSR
jgi:hypothetical protein